MAIKKKKRSHLWWGEGISIWWIYAPKEMLFEEKKYSIQQLSLEVRVQKTFFFYIHLPFWFLNSNHIYHYNQKKRFGGKNPNKPNPSILKHNSLVKCLTVTQGWLLYAGDWGELNIHPASVCCLPSYRTSHLPRASPLMVPAERRKHLFSGPVHPWDPAQCLASSKGSVEMFYLEWTYE